MKLLPLQNPFGAPVYHEETVSSTFDAARTLAAQGEVHGTVICTDYQEAGRGRPKPGAAEGRPWSSERGKNLLFTILLRYGSISSIPPLLTLRTGLAISKAIEDLVPALAGSVKLKWPNDVMIGPLKAAGILTETDGSSVYIGVGVNVAQTGFPEECRFKAGSLIQACPGLDEGSRFVLLDKILVQLYVELEREAHAGSWREQLMERLYKKGETVIFSEGAADSDALIEGTLSGIGPQGEILIIPKGEEKEQAFANGELRVY